MPRALIALGSNLGAREDLLHEAIERLQREPGTQVVAHSRTYETRAVGGPAGQPMYLNAAAVVETCLAPEPLLESLLGIELELGRHRTDRWTARPIDLDLLLYEQRVVCGPRLVIPHPRMAWRRFVLQPAAEVAADWIHPSTGWSIARLLEHLDTAPQYVAVAGAIGAGKTELAGAIVARAGGRALLETVDAGRLAAFYADPAGEAWSTEIEFLRKRGECLDASAASWQDRDRLVVSDFWFDQSMAFAQVWLGPRACDDFRSRFQQLRRGVVRPKLIVLLEASAEQLRERIVARARPYEPSIPTRRLDEIRASLDVVAGWPDQGPVLRLPLAEPAAMVAEVLAAIEAMH